MPSFTFVSANSFVLRGAKPIFVDIDPITFNIDPTQIIKAISPKTKAIVVVHYAGVACDMDEIVNIASENHIFLIEDAAQALLSSYKGKPLGSFGDLACFSFHETKNITCGEGGALILNNQKLSERAEILRERVLIDHIFLGVQLISIPGLIKDLLFYPVNSTLPFYMHNLSFPMTLLSGVYVYGINIMIPCSTILIWRSWA